MKGLAPFSDPRTVPGAALAWVKRRTFVRIFSAMMDAALSIRPLKASRQTDGGMAFTLDIAGDDAPFTVTMTTNGVNVSAGCVTVAGAHLPFILSGFVECDGAGFIVIRTSLILDQWSIGSSGSTIRSEFAGWVRLASDPVLAFVTAPDQMIAETDWSPMTVDNMQISFPIAYVDTATGRVVPMCNHAVGIGVLKNSDGLWPEAIYSLQ